MTAFNLSTLTQPQRALIHPLITPPSPRCRYDFTKCLPALQTKWGKGIIDVVFSDLSKFAGARVAGDHDHGPGSLHVTDPETGAVGHGIQLRHRVLGLAWSNGKIELDLSLESQPELAQEVFLSEVWHEAEWFDPAVAANLDRIAIAFHPEGPDAHDFYDVGPYAEWIGEAGMGAFVAATSDVKVTLTQFVHTVTPEVVRVFQDILDTAPKAIPLFHSFRLSKVFHRMSHRRLGMTGATKYVTREAAIADGLRACRVCKP